jgi:hypothetical protein
MSLSIFFLGSIAGAVFANIVWRSFFVGTLHVDTSDPDGPYLFLELSKGVDNVVRKEYIVMKVKTENFLPPK